MIPKDDSKHFEAFQRAANLSKRLIRKLTPILGSHYAAAAVFEGAVDALVGDVGPCGAAAHLRDRLEDIESEPAARLQ